MQRNRPDKIRRYQCSQACNTCKRRKEKCNGGRPCVRCVQRGVHVSCHYKNVLQSSSAHAHVHYEERQLGSATPDFRDLETAAQNQQLQNSDSSLAFVENNASTTTSIHETARHLQDPKGTYMFIGDSSNLSLVQTARNLVNQSIGQCAFVEDPFRYQMVESVPDAATWLHAVEHPPKMTFDEAVYLIRRFVLATNYVLDLFDEDQLLNDLPAWLHGSSEQPHVRSTMYCLVIAIGAQTCPEDKDALANSYYDHGRYLTAAYLSESPSIATVQAHAMITMYLLGASRRNAAFMALGAAVRAAHALGLHRPDIAKFFPPSAIRTRERVWKVLRVLDLFMSASLGRPPSTEETRDTEVDGVYSASTDLCAIFEKILIDVYAKRMISTDALRKISSHHRRWTACFRKGLEADAIKKEPFLTGGVPNIGLIHIKEAYHWSIILLTRPFFVEFISANIKLRSQINDNSEIRSNQQPSDSQQVLVHACVTAAINVVNLLKVLLEYKDIPKRLPFIFNALFVSGLVIGLANFGDLYKTYSLDDNLDLTIKLFTRFTHDDVAKRNLAILELLRDACTLYVQRQKNENLARHTDLVESLFGLVDDEVGKDIPRIANVPGNVTPSFDSRRSSVGRAGVPGLTLPKTGSIHNSSDQGHNGCCGIDAAVITSCDQVQSDIFTLFPDLSQGTLQFGPHEDNMPLFSTVDAQAFLE